MQLIPRAYQLSIYNSVKTHGNTLVVLPTGLGKTLIALMLISDRMKLGRCLLLTPTKPLAKQHQHSVMKTLELSEKNVVLVTGEVSPKKRKEAYLTDIIISTPQTIRNDLENGTLEPRFSLVVFDECVDGNARIRLFDGSEVPIKKVVKQRRPIFVQTYNAKENRTEVKEVIGFHEIPCRKDFVTVRLGGFSINCTADHLILCDRDGVVEWKRAADLDARDRVAVRPPLDTDAGKVRIRRGGIISEVDIRDTYTGNWNRAKQHLIRTMKKMAAGILPVDYQNPNLLTVARLFGYALGDGWLTLKNGQPTFLGFCGLKSDLGLVSRDIKALGGRHSKLYSRMTRSNIMHGSKEITVEGRSESFLCTSSHIVRTMYALGFPVGDKATTKYDIPDWISNAPPYVIREFLSGLVSAEAHVPTPMKNKRTFFVNRLTFYKDKKLRAGGMRYAENLVSLFKKVGVRAVYRIKRGNVRKNGAETLRFELTFGNSMTNQIAFLNAIAFAYSKEKSAKANSIFKYLLAKKKGLDERRELWLRSKKLHAGGFSARKISKIMNVGESTIESWVYMGRRPVQTSVFFPPFGEWVDKRRNLEVPFIWERVTKIEKTKTRPQFVYDLTVRDNANYIANGIFVHNCHRAVGDYAYTQVAEKLHGKDTLFLGLTASPGGRMDRIREVMNALKIDNVEIRSHDDPDVAPYVQKSEVSWVPVLLSDHFRDIKKELDTMTGKYAERLSAMGFPPPLKHKGKFMQLRERILNIPHNIKYPALVQYSILLHLLHMTELLETQGVYPLRGYLVKLEGKDSKSAAQLLNEPGLARVRMLAQKDEDHPKMIVLVDTIRAMKGKKMIVFVQYRSQIARIVEVLTGGGISAKQFVGKKDGVTKKIQEETIADFREGKFDVLVASSIGEEGLDIPAVDAVIFYEPVPSEIRAIQRRGRAGRLKEGRVIVLMTRGTRDEYYYHAANNRETRMKKILGGMQRAKKKGRDFQRADKIAAHAPENPPAPTPEKKEARDGAATKACGGADGIRTGAGGAGEPEEKKKVPPKQTRMTDF